MMLVSFNRILCTANIICLLLRYDAVIILCLQQTFAEGTNEEIHNSIRKNSGVNPRPVSTTKEGGIAADISWEFEDGLDDWGQATPQEMQAEVYWMKGIVRMKIEGTEPHMDSPKMSIPLGKRSTVAIRYRFVGYSKYGKIRLRGKTIPDNVDYGASNWEQNSSQNKDENQGEYGEDEFHDVYFPIKGDGKWRITYAKVNWNDAEGNLRDRFNSTITQMRIWPAVHRPESISKMPQKVYNSSPSSFVRSDNNEIVDFSPAPQNGNAFHIDWIRIVRGPFITRVTGCFGEKYSKSELFTEQHYFVTPVTDSINQKLYHYRTIWNQRTNTLPYGKTYNCVREGNEIITLEGYNFGVGGIDNIGAPAHVYIDDQPCTHVKHDLINPQRKLTCKTPALSQDIIREGRKHNTASFVSIQNGKLNGLQDKVPFLQYADAPPIPRNLSLSNFASRSIDISWSPGGSIWDHFTYTGYVIHYRVESCTSWDYTFVVGNVTTTTIRGLEPDTSYYFAVSGLTENQAQVSWWNNSMDLYGRRELIPGGLEGNFATITGKTLQHDLYFPFFDSNFTQDHGPVDERSTIGPTGITTGEGNYGLRLMGDANIENCNASSFCCDVYDEELNRCSTDINTYTCRVFSTQKYDEYTVYSEEEYPASLVLPGLGKTVEPVKNDIFHSRLFTSKCGPALRLTGSHALLRGAAWYPRQMEVGEGFDTEFLFRLSNPSVRCSNLDDVFTRCRSRGADGFAFVIQVDREDALGDLGHGLGYSGIPNSLAIEFDTYYNHEYIEPYENHISVHTRGWRHNNDSNQTFSLGHTNDIPDLTDGDITIRIRYVPRFDPMEISTSRFDASPYIMQFIQNKDWTRGGLGMLYIYCENLLVLVVPLNLASTLKLNRGRAWVGFTAATGEATWQTHDILNWRFSSLREDAEYFSSNQQSDQRQM